MISAGTVIAGRYQLVRVAGTGGSSRVWEAVDLSLRGRTVAVKELAVPSIGRDEARRVRALFHRETDVLTRLAHPGLPAIYDGLAEDDACYLVLEFVHGEVVDAWRRANIPSVAQAVDDGCDVAEILEYLHTRDEPLVVRDLKPSNLIRGVDGKLRLVDLGIASILRPDPAAGTVTLAGYGTPGYAAPEQYGRGEVDVRTDLYALGATLYFLLTGTAPPDAIDRILGRRPLEPIRAARPDAPPELARCIERGLLALDVAHRPASARAAADWLRRAILPEAQTADAHEARLRDPVDLRAGGGRILWLAYACDGRLLAASPDDGLLMLAHDVQAFNTGARVTSVACAPSAQVAAVASPEATIVLWTLDGSAPPRTFYEVPRGVACVAFSPDGSTLAAGLWDKSVRLWDVRSGMPGGVFQGHGGAVAAVAFSPDGRTLATASADRTVRVWTLASGACTQVLNGHHGPVHALCWLGDGARLATASRDRTVAVWSVPTNVMLHRLRGHTAAVAALAALPDGSLLASAAWDGTVRLWDPSSGLAVDTASLGDDAVTALACDGHFLAAGTRNGRIRRFSIGA